MLRTMWATEPCFVFVYCWLIIFGYVRVMDGGPWMIIVDDGGGFSDDDYG